MFPLEEFGVKKSSARAEKIFSENLFNFFDSNN